jgi:hypothetical protein
LPLFFTGIDSGFKINAVYFLRGLALEKLPSGNFRRVGLVQENFDVTRHSVFEELVGRQDGYAQVAVKPWKKEVGDYHC